MTQRDFTHLHTHTEFSLQDGIIKVNKLCEYVKECGMTACAITDHGVMGGVIEFYKAAKKVGIKPIVGMEAYLTFDKDGLENPDKTKDNFHCVMLAQNEIGLRNLIWLSNKAALENFYYKPRISVGNLHERSEGIIATSACLGGLAAKPGVYNKEKSKFIDPEGLCVSQLKIFSTIFKDRFYAEVQDHPHIAHQVAYNKWLIKQAGILGIPLVITADAHFLKEDDFETHRLVMAKNYGGLLKEYKEDDDGLVYARTHYIRTPDDMYESACKLGAEEAFWNTTEIAKQCELEITLGEYKYPHFDITQEDDYQNFLKWEKYRYD